MTAESVFLTIILFPFSSIVRGWVLTILWKWFAVQPLHAPQLSIPVAIGLVGIWTLLNVNAAAEDPEYKKQPFWIKMMARLFVDLFGLGFGWVVHLFV